MFRVFLAHNINTGELLVRVLTKMAIRRREIVTGENGKPYLASGELFFSLSSSGGVAVCAVADREIGVDIQRIEMREGAMRHAFNDKEQELVHSAEDFTRIWVLKEAFVKALGVGVGYGLKNIDTLDMKGAMVWRYDDFLIATCYNYGQS